MIEFESLKRKISEDPQSFVVIIGAGASVPGGLPTWNALKDMLCDALRDLRKSEDISEENIEKEIIAVNNAPNLWYTFSRLKSALGQLRYEKVIKTALSISGKATPQLYKQLWELNVAGIINFNIDLFAINSHSETRKSAVDYATAQEPHKYKNYPLCSDKFVLHPHGILSDAASWILTETDRSDLYTRNEDFKLVMTSLLNSKNLLVIGFNPVEWSFRELVNQIGMSRRINGYHNYYFCPEPDQHVRRELEDLGLSVIPYHPSTQMHEEINHYLSNIIGFHSHDAHAPSVYDGKVYNESDIPKEGELYKVGVNELRDILNGVVAGIIPPDRIPTEDQIVALEKFYNTYITQLHRAWLVDTRSMSTNSVYNYTAINNVGRGAFGSVYEVEDQNGNRYALKVLLPEVKDNIAYLSCFRRGIRSMEILKEKGIDGMVKIHDSYEVPACIIMDYVDGITLREAVDNRYINKLEMKLAILIKIAQVVHTAHQLEERILHRDLKPENVMIENCYSEVDFEDPGEIPTIKILDFDLSWHRGATEKTVMFGAISQGFMAPEQIDASADKALSRSTAVDVYSIGMLTYFVLTEANPMPNESLFATFPERVRKSLENKYRYSWRCLPEFLAKTILSATSEVPHERAALDTFITNLQIAKDMYLNNTIPNSHPLVMIEIMERIDCNGVATYSDYGRAISIEYSSIAKRIILATTSERSKIKLNVEVQRYIRSSDNRDGISKYFKTYKEKALAKVDSSIFSTKKGESSSMEVRIELSAILPDKLTLEYIDHIAENIAEIRASLDG